MAVNLFQHWLSGAGATRLATLLEVPSRNITAGGFEDRFPVCPDSASHGFRVDPHLDFALRYDDGGRVGVECKLFEPYGRLDDKPLRSAYLDLDSTWDDIPASRELATHLCDGGAGYRRLGASQLIKHILGLKSGVEPRKWRLVYLYLDAPGDEAAELRDEIRRFAEAVGRDGIQFMPLSVQEFVLRAVSRVRADHRDYVDYLAERYV